MNLRACVFSAAALILSGCNGVHDPGVAEPDSAVSALDGQGQGATAAADENKKPDGESNPAKPNPAGTDKPKPPASDENQYIQQNRLFLEIIGKGDSSKCDEILEGYRRRAGDKPEDPVERFLYAWALFIFDKDDDALTHFEKTKSLRRNFIWADFGLAVIRTRRKEDEKAAAALKDLQDSASDDVWKHLLLGEILITRDKLAGEKLFEDIRKKFPESAEPLKALARFYANEKDYERALKLLDKAVERAPDDPLVSFYKGLVFLQRTEREKNNPQSLRQSLNVAEQHFEECLKKLDEASDLTKVVKALLEMIEINLSPWVKASDLATDVSKPEGARIKAAKFLEEIGPAVPLKFWMKLIDVSDKNPHIRISGIRGLAFRPEPEALDKLSQILEGDSTGHDFSNAAFAVSEIERQKPEFKSDAKYRKAVFKALLAALRRCAEKGWTLKFEEISNTLNAHSGKSVNAANPTEDKMKNALSEWSEIQSKEFAAEGGSPPKDDKEGAGK